MQPSLFLLKGFLSSSSVTWPPTQVKGDSFRLRTGLWAPDCLEPGGWWLRLLGHHPVSSSPPADQRKVTYPVDLSLDFAYENCSLQTIEEFRVFFEHWQPQTYNKGCIFLHHSPSIDWHRCVGPSWFYTILRWFWSLWGLSSALNWTH